MSDFTRNETSPNAAGAATGQGWGLAASHRFRVTFFKDHAAASKREQEWTLVDLADRIRPVIALRKEELEWLKLARFGEVRTDKKSLRHDGNVLAVSGVEGDYDGERVPMAEAVERAEKAGLLALFYTSPSHTEDKPRWRVLCPFSEELPPAERWKMMGRLNGLFGGIFSVESWTLSQSYYFGGLGGNPSYRVEVVDGRPVDELDELDETSIGKPHTASANGANGTAEGPRSGPVDEAALLREITTGASYHPNKVRLAGLWSRKGVAYMDARARLVAAFDAVPEAERDERYRKRRVKIDRVLEDIYGKDARAEDAEPDGRPVIRIAPGEIHRIVDEAEAALIAGGCGFYRRGAFLVRPRVVQITIADDRETAGQRLAPVDADALMEAMSATARWEKYNRRAKGWVPSDPAAKAPAVYLSRAGEWKLPFLAGIVNAPTLRPDGSVLSAPGYDAATGLLFDPRGAAFPAIPERPTRDAALEALAALRHELLSEFPFVGEADRAVALSAILTACVRRSLTTAPMHAFSAPVAGSGKSKLVDIASVIACGREAGVIAQGKSEEETEKRLGALLLAGDALVSIDNCEAPLGGEFLCQVLTQTIVRARILGKSEAPELPSGAFVTATGNNLELVGDMTRRALLCRLDPGVERPELRRFDREPVEHAKRHRGRFVAAALTVLRAYHAAGRPASGAPLLGSFEGWSRWIRDALVWLGEDDPAATIEVARASDTKLAALRAVVEQWHQHIGVERTTTRALIAAATRMFTPTTADSPDLPPYPAYGRKEPDPAVQEFREALLAVAGAGGAINGRKLGHWLRGNRGRVVDGWRIVQDGLLEGTMTWCVERA